jgi:GDP/UDP-N,N'-diacetylbacillosamine 2-epimerase (hydrolysing)
MRKICVVTGSRAEYGLLYWLMKEIQSDKDLELQIVVTGMHLSPEFGLTWKEIQNDGFVIQKKVEMLLSSDTSVGVAKAVGIGCIGFAEVWEELEPDIVVVLGDRFEILSTVISAMIARLPVAHLHGGESTEGLIDESIRHAITKMSHLHFTAAEEYRARVIQLGEQPDRVFNVGGLGIDNIKKLSLLSKSNFEKSIGFSLKHKNLLVTYHPVTLENSASESQMKVLIDVLDKMENTLLIFTKPNADTDGRIIIDLIDEYVLGHSDKAVAFTSLGQLRYLSALQFVDGVIGNSSSGLLEVPSFKIGTVNIGDRQRGRLKASSIIDSNPEKESIKMALKTLYSQQFKNKLKNVTNPYGEGDAAEKIKEVLKFFHLGGILKKSFFNLGAVS